ncbi:zinc finger protein 438-like isoform X2 [Sinocyclocheilus rhinocerous]|uniref:Zinc finger protein 438-like n=2 Tax=Sinocyclocheilus rhinocerous TaxID=307959 RepID=A0A673L5G5_9TELE|nr:PREDICTED: zinc finger protein 438-like isoform X2 [Sinocyclocheilus rhinocerous]XP_016366217.1 PREDICTED: zinc finger protein 438-like isoform X2 [Sinocyclocheilus rhinocerous]XP_016366218.1 PREDICTED: zinc finger protein 438-like isoform X2 [Sinocyclocheilus rhinocerous]XP_016366219.1 PREDICTED: zinc finger protein 438-like isoform X2 [Sinocyclocheilus rhinocerous]
MKTQEHRSSPLKSHTQSDARPHSQMKGLQFRSIAPKAPAVVPSSAVLSCQPPSALPEASTAVSPKSILVPAQNYALMQVAGQEGTFSLVALPQTQQQQPIQKNLKLPIPRYQPVRSKSAPEKGSSKMPSPAKVSATIQAQSPAVKSDQSSDPVSEHLVLIDAPTSSEINVGPLLPGSQTDRKVEQKSDAGPLKNQHYPSGNSLVAPVMKISPVKTQIEGQASAGSAITVLSPTIFSKAVQIIPSPPKGKLPILPYAKVKNSLLAPTSLASTPFSEKQTGAKSSLKSPPDNKIKSTDSKVKSESLSQDHNNTQIKKPPGKKRGRKRKTMEDILAFEARKKRSLSFFRRRVPEKPPTGVSNPASQEKLLDISKKYRSIRPKPVLVVETTIPQLVPLPSLSTSENLDQELVLGQQISGKQSSAPQSSQATDQQPVVECKGGGGVIYTGSRPLHRCPTCNRCFQFKHHLQSHMNSHSNLRPYVCPVCRKAYAHSGSLSTHMKLHHAESRPRKSLCCEFCEKSFGYVGVYFSHLREVHRVILTVEPSISQHEESMSVGESSEADEQASEQRVDPVELQIKCGRCQAITPTFADMKLHLLYVHGEEVQVRLRDGAMRGGREAEDELVKHAAHYWRQLNEKRNLVHCGTCDEEFFSFSKFKRHLHSHHQEDRESQEEEDEEEMIGKGGHVLRGLSKGISLRVGSHFNCILCSKVFNKKQDVIEHWRAQHNCENPTLLWDVLDFKGESKLIDGPN